MPRTSKARVFRSSQTSPNATTVRDLTTTFGTAANAATVAGFATGGLVTSVRWNPNVAATAASVIPAVGAASSGQGWRDTVAENPNDPVRYDAGTWTLRARLTKTGQAVAADITVRVTLIAYQVSSAGAFVGEIGRVQMADTVLSTTTLTLTGSFVTAAVTDFATGDKVQVEAYVQPVTAGLPAAPTASVNVNFVVDETSANSGASFTVIPGHQFIYSRASSDVARASETVARSSVTARSIADVARAADTVTRAAAFPRATTDVARAADTTARQVAFPRATGDTAKANDTLARSTTAARTLADTARAADTVGRVINYVRGIREQIGPGAGDFVDVPSRVLAGVVRNNTGVPVVGATVLLMRVSDDRAVQSTTSGVGGSYSFVRDKFDLQTYYVVSYLAGSPSTQGVTERGLAPVDA